MTIRYAKRRLGGVALASVILLLTGVVVSVPAGAAGAGPEVVAFHKGSDVWLGNLTTGSSSKIVSNAYHPAVSPDGQHLAYSTSTGTYVADIDGTHARLIASGSQGHVSDWSPDSGTMAYISPAGVQLVDVGSLAKTTVPNVPEADVYWSPDGTFLLYAQGTSAVTISPSGTGQVVHPNTDVGPISPGGANVLFTEDSPTEVLTSNLITGAVTILAGGDSADFLAEPIWRSDGQDICFTEQVDQDAPVPHSGPSGLMCGSIQVPGGDEPSIGGGTRPVDTNGAPHAVTNLTATSGPNTATLTWTPPTATPDSTGVAIRYTIGTTPPATAHAGLDGGRYLAEHTATLTHLPKNQRIAISVFTLDAFGHASRAATTAVTTPNQDASTLTVAANPFDLVYPNSTTITGTLSDAYTGTPLTDTTLTVARQLWNTTGPFTTIGTVTTSSTGSYTVKQIPGISYNYRFDYPETTDHAATQIIKTVRVAPAVTITPGHTRAPAGTAVHLTISTAPAQPNAKTYLYQIVGTSPRLIGPHNTDSSGRETLTVTAPPRGDTRTYRLVVPGAGSYINGTSPEIAITGT